MPALQREAEWAEERLWGDLRQSVPQNGRVHLHIVEGILGLYYGLVSAPLPLYSKPCVAVFSGGCLSKTCESCLTRPVLAETAVSAAQP